jgi:DNA-binding NarL/FixJ family response regulator
VAALAEYDLAAVRRDVDGVAAAARAFEALGMRGWAQRAAAAGRGMPPPRPAGLTAREVEVLRLLAAGRTSQEIAAELVVSVPTVNRHVANIYTKIDVRNRAEATSFAISAGLA